MCSEEKTKDLVLKNVETAQGEQKRWYDRKARTQEFVGVLILLPTDTKKLLARWQGPYKIIWKIGKVNYQVDMT